MVTEEWRAAQHERDTRLLKVHVWSQSVRTDPEVIRGETEKRKYMLTDTHTHTGKALFSRSHVGESPMLTVAGDKWHPGCAPVNMDKTPAE